MGFPELLAAVDRSVRKVTGGPVIYTPGSGPPVTVTGIFDARYVKVDLGQAGVSSCSPAVFLTLADLPTDPSDDLGARVTVAGVVYEVREAEPDGMGATLLLLHEV